MMSTSTKTIDINVERVIPAQIQDVFDGWFDSTIPGTVWNAAEKFIIDAKVDGLFYWALKGTAHYGRFTEIKSPTVIQHTWVSPNTSGKESKVVVTFKEQGANTLMTLVHSDLPETDEARGHERGWNYFLDIFGEQFGVGSHREYQWEEAHPEDANNKG